MDTINSIKYKIADLLGRSNDNALLASLEEAIWDHRAAIYIEQEEIYHKGLNWSSSFDMELVFDDMMDLCGEDCLLLRTKEEIPSPIIFNNDSPLTVRTVNKVKKAVYTTPEHYNFIKHLKYIHKDIFYFYHNNYVYIPNNKLLKHINIEGVFERPDKLGKFVNCTNCITVKSEIPKQIAAEIMRRMLSSELQIYSGEYREGGENNEN